jgi:hypothetical protein
MWDKRDKAGLMDILTYSKHVKYRFVKTLVREIKADIIKSQILDLVEQSYNTILSKELTFDRFSKVNTVNFYKCAVSALNAACTKSPQLAKSKQNLIRRVTPTEFDKHGFFSEDFIAQLPYGYTFLKEDELYKYISVNYKIYEHNNVGYDQDCMDNHSLYVYTNNIVTYIKEPLKWGCPINPAELNNVELCDILQFNNNLSEYRGSLFASFLIKKFTQESDFTKNINIPVKGSVTHKYKPSKNMGYVPESFNCFPTTDRMLKFVCNIH